MDWWPCINKAIVLRLSGLWLTSAGRSCWRRPVGQRTHGGQRQGAEMYSYMHRIILPALDLHTCCRYTWDGCSAVFFPVYVSWGYRQHSYSALINRGRNCYCWFSQQMREGSGHYSFVTNSGAISYSMHACGIQSKKKKKRCSKRCAKIQTLVRATITRTSAAWLSIPGAPYMGESFIWAHCHLFISLQSDILCKAWDVINQSLAGH